MKETNVRKAINKEDKNKRIKEKRKEFHDIPKVFTDYMIQKPNKSRIIISFLKTFIILLKYQYLFILSYFTLIIINTLEKI